MDASCTSSKENANDAKAIETPETTSSRSGLLAVFDPRFVALPGSDHLPRRALAIGGGPHKSS